MALTKFGRETHKITTHNGQDSASAVRFATKRYTCRRDEDDSEDAFVGCICGGDDDELEESDCLRTC